MGTISDKLSYLAETKRLIKELMIEKGANVQDDTPFREYVNLISTLSGDTQFVISEPVDVVLSASKWDGSSYYARISSYNCSISGIQVGLPVSSSAINTQTVVEAAISIQDYSNTAPSETYAGSTSIYFSAVNVPAEDITVAVYGLVPTDVITTTETEVTE